MRAVGEDTLRTTRHEMKIFKRINDSHHISCVNNSMRWACAEDYINIEINIYEFCIKLSMLISCKDGKQN